MDRKGCLPKPGQPFGDYEIIEEIGRGGMGLVYKARHRKLDRMVALKVLLPSSWESGKSNRRFLQEARILAQIEHHNLVAVYHVGSWEGLDFLEMQLVDGPSAGDILQKGPLDAEEACRIAEQAAQALSQAHRRGIIHRDIKPGNILLTSDGVVKVVDFGLAKEVKVEAGLSVPGTVMGTPEYMAPEQWMAKSVDARADLYSLGATLYHLLTGQPPFSGDQGGLMDAHLHLQPRPLQEVHAGIPEELGRIVLKLLEKDPERRYRSAEELIEDLRSWQHSPAGEEVHPGAPEKAGKPIYRKPFRFRLPGRAGSIRAMIAGGLIGLAVLGFHAQGLFEVLELWSLDLRFAWTRGLGGESPVAIVVIDQESKDLLAPHGTLSREKHCARLLERLSDAGARAIALDLLFLDPASPDEDGALGAITRLAPGVIHSLNLSMEPTARAPEANAGFPPEWSLPVTAGGLIEARRAEAPVPEIARACPRIGHVSLTPDPDSVIRRLPLLMAQGGKVYPSLSLAAAMAALGTKPEDVEYKEGTWIELRPHGAGALRIPVDSLGRMLVNYRWDELRIPCYPLWRAIGSPGSPDAPIDPSAFKDKVVFFGSMLAGDYDVGSLPGRPLSPLVRAHAMAADTILQEAFVLTPDGAWAAAIIFGLALAASAAASLARPAIASAALVLTASLYIALSFWAFSGKTRAALPLAAPVAALAACAVGATFFRFWSAEKEKRRLSEALARYLSPAVTARLLSEPGRLKLGGRRKELTVLCLELIDFQETTERLEPEEIDEFMGLFLERMTEIIFRHEGTLDRFTGTGLRAFFGDPVPQEDHASRAVRCALELRAAALQVVAKWAGPSRPKFKVGIGIHTGYVTVGNVGSEWRMEYTVLGRNVQIAGRLAALEPSKVIAGARTAALTKGEFRCVKRREPCGDMECIEFTG